MHGSDPLAYGSARFGHPGNGCRLKLVVGNVRLDLVYGVGRYVVLVVLEQRVQEPSRVLQQGLSRFPVVVDLGSQLLAGHLLGFDALHDAHRLHDQLHTGWRTRHRPYLCGDLRYYQ